MMGKINSKVLISAIGLFVFAACSELAKHHENSGQVPLQTYIITYKTTVNQDQLKSQSIMTQWIDNVNNRFAVQTKTNTEIGERKLSGESLMIQSDGWSYVINLTEKSGFKSKSPDNETLIKTYARPSDEKQFREMIEDENGKILGNEVLLTRQCVVIEITEAAEEGAKLLTKMWYYNGIPLKMVNKYATMEAITFDENVSIPPDKFQVPVDVEINTIPSF